MHVWLLILTRLIAQDLIFTVTYFWQITNKLKPISEKPEHGAAHGIFGNTLPMNHLKFLD